jgi:hypothetical protein
MAIETGQITVGTTRVQIDGSSVSEFKIILHNSGSNAIYLGTQSVTENNGFNLHANSTLTLELPPLTHLYAVTRSGNHDMTWMRIT